MPREAKDREDLFNEASNLSRRIELSEGDQSIIVGFEKDHGLRCYFGQGVMYGFNAQDELRRCFVDGIPLAARGGQLEQLTLQRTGNRLGYLNTPLSEEQTAAVLTRAGSLLVVLLDLLARGAPCLRAFPEEEHDSIREQAIDRLQTITRRPTRIARHLART